MRFEKKPARAIVVGSGFGGLGVAIRLQLMGIETTIVERRDKPGGRAYVHEVGGFTFDAGPTVITAPETITDLFHLAKRPIRNYVELLPVSPMYRLFWEDGARFDYTADDQEFLSQLRRIAPDDEKGYLEFFRYTKEVYHEGYEKLGHVAFLRMRDMMKAAPQLARLKAWKSVYDVVASYVKNDKLRQALSFNSLLVGGNPFKVSSIYTLIHPLEKKGGVFFPRGGMHALVRGLIKLFEDVGGRIQLNADVDRITTSDGRATGCVLTDGRRFESDIVVCNSDVLHTYKYLLRDEPRATPIMRKLQKARFSMSLFVMYFGTNRQWDGILHHNVMFGPRYRELLDDIFDNGVVADDFSLYLHAPTKTDPSVAPRGHHAFYVLSPVPHLGKCPYSWEEKKEEYGERILTYLEKHYMPGLRQHIVVKKFCTPHDFQSDLNAPNGAAFSLEPILTQSAWFRVHNRDPRIGGLFFVGAGTHPGAGVPGVLGSARATADVIQGMIPGEMFEGVPFAAPTAL